MRKIRRSDMLWLVAYAAVMAAIVLLVWQMRSSVLAQLDNGDARAKWQEWQQAEEARAAAKSSSTVRRPPRIAEPPAVILLRDHFPGILAGCLVTGTAIFAVVAFLLRGVLAQRGKNCGLGIAD